MPKVEGVQHDNGGRPFWEHPDCRVADEEADLLFGLVVATRPSVIAEVGTGLMGSLSSLVRASQYMQERLGWKSDIYTCDIDASKICAAENRFPAITAVHGIASDMVSVIDGRIDFAFIDGCHLHDSVRGDYEALRKSASDRCVIVFHDAQEHAILSAVKEYGGVLLPTPRGMGVVRCR